MPRPVVRTHARHDAPYRASLESGLRATEGALAAHVRRTGVHPSALRQGLARAMAYTVRQAFPEDVELSGEILLGLGGGPRREVHLGGLHLSVSLADPPLVAPHAVSLLHRHQGTVHIVHDVELGAPAALAKASAELDLPDGCLIGALEAIVRDLGRLTEPVAPLGAVHLPDEAGWEVFRFVQVREEVHDARLHIAVNEAQVLEPESRPGDLLGVSLPSQDWLTPTLCWLGGAG
jgi:hypothetical protein